MNGGVRPESGPAVKPLTTFRSFFYLHPFLLVHIRIQSENGPWETKIVWVTTEYWLYGVSHYRVDCTVWITVKTYWLKNYMPKCMWSQGQNT